MQGTVNDSTAQPRSLALLVNEFEHLARRAQDFQLFYSQAHAFAYRENNRSVNLHWTSTPTVNAQKVAGHDIPFALRFYWEQSKLPEEFFEGIDWSRAGLASTGIINNHRESRLDSEAARQYERMISALELVLGIAEKSVAVVFGKTKDRSDYDLDSVYAAWKIFPYTRAQIYLIAARRAIEGRPMPEKVWFVDGNLSEFLTVEQSPLQKEASRPDSPLAMPISLKDFGKLYVKAYKQGAVNPKVQSYR